MWIERRSEWEQGGKEEIGRAREDRQQEVWKLCHLVSCQTVIEDTFIHFTVSIMNVTVKTEDPIKHGKQQTAMKVTILTKIEGQEEDDDEEEEYRDEKRK